MYGDDFLHSFENDGLRFEVIDRGPRDARATTVLLHGFPQDAGVWTDVATELCGQGFRVLIPYQRGYTAGAMPARISDYAVERLVSDVIALLDSAGIQDVHLVGHDWGGVVAWGVAMHFPDRVRTITSVSMPSPRALAISVFSPPQVIRSWYVGVMQIPVLPELLLTSWRGKFMIHSLIRTGMPPQSARIYVKRMLDRKKGVAHALAWYRAVRLDAGYLLSEIVTVPSMLVFGSADKVITPWTAMQSRRQVKGNYALVGLENAGHWIPDQNPRELVDCLRFCRQL